jgi:hypothetical protein
MAQMIQLADAFHRNACGVDDVVARGTVLLQRLDIDSAEYAHAVDESYESGNRFWMWHRLAKQSRLNGGILSVDHSQLVPLHDHPGAVGMLRILSGEVMAWQFDRSGVISPQGTAELKLVSRKILRRGDTASLTPHRGGIHALQSITAECRMLDFFIPPYNRQQRIWYQPIESAWSDNEIVTCKALSEEEFYSASPA